MKKTVLSILACSTIFLSGCSGDFGTDWSFDFGVGGGTPVPTLSQAKIAVCPSWGGWPKTTPYGASNAGNLPAQNANNTGFWGVSEAWGPLNSQLSRYWPTWNNWVQWSGNDRYPGVRLGSGPRTLTGIAPFGWYDSASYIQGMGKGQYLGAHREYSAIENGCDGNGSLLVRLKNRSNSFNGSTNNPNYYNANGETGLVNRVAMTISAPMDNSKGIEDWDNTNKYGFSSIKTNQNMFMPLWNQNADGWQARSVTYNPGYGEDSELGKILTGCFGYHRIESVSNLGGTSWCEDEGTVTNVPLSGGGTGNPGWDYADYLPGNNGRYNFFDNPNGTKRNWYDLNYPVQVDSSTSPAISSASPRQEFVSEVFCAVYDRSTCYTGWNSEVGSPGHSGIRDFVGSAIDKEPPMLNLGNTSIVNTASGQGQRYSWISNRNQSASYRFKVMDKGFGVGSYYLVLNGLTEQIPFTSTASQCTEWGYIGGDAVQYRLDRNFEVAGTGSNSVSGSYVSPHYTINHPPICPTAVEVNQGIDLNQNDSQGQKVFREGINTATVTARDYNSPTSSTNANSQSFYLPILIDSAAPTDPSITNISGVKCYSASGNNNCSSLVNDMSQVKWVSGGDASIRSFASDPAGQTTAYAPNGQAYSSSGMAANGILQGFKINGSWGDSCLSSGTSGLYLLESADNPTVGNVFNEYFCEPSGTNPIITMPANGTVIRFAADIRDVAGNMNQYQGGEFRVDSAAPQNTSRATETPGVVTLSAQDATSGSGVKRIMYRPYLSTNTATSPTWIEAPNGTTLTNQGPVEIKTIDNLDNESISTVINPVQPAVSVVCDTSKKNSADWYNSDFTCEVTATRAANSPAITSITRTFTNGSSTETQTLPVSPAPANQNLGQNSTVTASFTVSGVEGVSSLTVTALGETGMTGRVTNTIRKDGAPPVVDTFSASPNVDVTRDSVDTSGSLADGVYKGFVRLATTSQDPFVSGYPLSTNQTDPWFINSSANQKSRLSLSSSYGSTSSVIRNSFAQTSSGVNLSGNAYIACSVELHSELACQARPTDSTIELDTYLPSEKRWFVLNQASLGIAEVCSGTASSASCIFDTSKSPFRPGDVYYIRYRSIDSAGNISYSNGIRIQTTGVCALPAKTTG